VKNWNSPHLGVITMQKVRSQCQKKIWAIIQNGGEYIVESESWYEGEMYPVTWTFGGKNFDIDGEDGRQCLVDGCLEDLIVKEK
jgi:hypothetical protein